MEKSRILFYIDEKLIEFNLSHNLKEYGLDLELALNSWIYRTKDFTKKSFIDYLKNKEPFLKLE